MNDHQGADLISFIQFSLGAWKMDVCSCKHLTDKRCRVQHDSVAFLRSWVSASITPAVYTWHEMEHAWPDPNTAVWLWSAPKGQADFCQHCRIFSGASTRVSAGKELKKIRTLLTRSRFRQPADGSERWADRDERCSYRQKSVFLFHQSDVAIEDYCSTRGGLLGVAALFRLTFVNLLLKFKRPEMKKEPRCVSAFCVVSSWY